MSRRDQSAVPSDCKRRPPSRTPPILEVRWCRGDENVLDVLLSRCGPTLARRMSKRFWSLLAKDECEEIVSLALARAWSHRADFDPEKGTLEAWLWEIAYHRAAEEVRDSWLKERLNESAVAPEKLNLLVAPLGLDAREAPRPAVSGRPHLVTLALQSLPERQKAVLWADACSPTGFASSGPLAHELGVKPSTIRSLRRRGRAKLKAEFVRLELHARSGGGADD